MLFGLGLLFLKTIIIKLRITVILSHKKCNIKNDRYIKIGLNGIKRKK